ncbi:hypothetical protein D3C76_1219930 [compost metagenome]
MLAVFGGFEPGGRAEAAQEGALLQPCPLGHRRQRDIGRSGTLQPVLHLENRPVAMAKDRREVAAALAGAVTVFDHQKACGAGGDARPQQAIHQTQA